MTDEEYLIKYQEKYGKLDDEGKEYVLKCKKETDNMTEEELPIKEIKIEKFDTITEKKLDDTFSK